MTRFSTTLAVVAAAMALGGLFGAPAASQRYDQPPRIESTDPLDPLSIEGGAQRTGAPPRNSGAAVAPPVAAPTPPSNSRDDPATRAAPRSDEAEAEDVIDLDELKQRLLEEGSAPLRELEPAPPVPGTKVVLRGLDKMTGALSQTEAIVGETATLWRLEIDVRACFSRVEASQSAAGSAFLKIRDTKNDGDEQVFSGWMFAASPALSAMDHPRYDVWVLSCSTS